MRPGAEEARMLRQMRREQQAQMISDLLLGVCLAAIAFAVYWGLFQPA